MGIICKFCLILQIIIELQPQNTSYCMLLSQSIAIREIIGKDSETSLKSGILWKI